MLLGGFQGNRCDFKLENRMYIHVCSALTERHIIYHLFNQLWWFLKEKAPIDGGKGGFTSHTLTVPRPKSLLFSLWSLNMLIIALNCYHFQNNCLVILQNFVNENELVEFWNLQRPWNNITSPSRTPYIGSTVCLTQDDVEHTLLVFTVPIRLFLDLGFFEDLRDF